MVVITIYQTKIVESADRFKDGWSFKGQFRSPVSVCAVHVMSGRPQVLVLDGKGSTSWKIAFEHLLEAHSERKKTQLKLKCEGVFL